MSAHERVPQRFTPVLLLIVGLGISPAVAQIDIDSELNDLGDHVWVIPAAATSSGLAGTSWISDVVIHNPDAFDALVFLVHLPRVGEGSASRGQEFPVPGRRSLHLENALAPFGENITGGLLVVSDRPLQVFSRSFNNQPEGTYGQFIDGVPIANTLHVDHEGTLIQLTEDQGTRTNLALANPLPHPITVVVDAFSADGVPLSTTTHFLPGLSSIFSTRFLQPYAPGSLSDAFAVVRPVTSGGRVAPMASVVDAQTGDPMTQLPQEDRSRFRLVTIGHPPELQHNDWNDLAFAHGKWLAAGENGLAVSGDGIHWELVVDLSSSWDDLLGIAFNGRRIIAFNCGKVWTSDDGESWASHETPDICLISVTWDGTGWFAVQGGHGNRIATSRNGVSWQSRDIQGAHLEGAIRGGDRYVGWTRDGVANSVDGISWEGTDLGDRLWKVVWNGERYLGVSRGFFAGSTDGTTWEVRHSSRSLYDVLWTGNRWVAGTSSPDAPFGHYPGFMVSADGEIWEDVAPPGRDSPVTTLACDGTTVMGLDIYRWITFLIGNAPTTVPAAAHSEGLGGARWRSDLELHNHHDEPVVCEIEFLERDTGNIRPASQTVTIDGSTSVRLVDVVGGTFAIEGAGALRITPTENTVLVSSRSYDDTDNGTYGQLVPGFRSVDAIWHFDTGRLIGLAHSPSASSGFRTNVGLVSDCARSMEVKIDLYDGDGEHLGAVNCHLWPYGVKQLNNVFRQVSDDEVTSGLAFLRTLTPMCSFYAYASVVDNRTNDPVLIPAVHE